MHEVRHRVKERTIWDLGKLDLSVFLFLFLRKIKNKNKNTFTYNLKIFGLKIF